MSAGMGTEEPVSKENPKPSQWCDLSCPAACFISAGIMILGINWWWNPPPYYAFVIRDLLGFGLLFVGFYFAWKWHKQGS